MKLVPDHDQGMGIQAFKMSHILVPRFRLPACIAQAGGDDRKCQSA